MVFNLFTPMFALPFEILEADDDRTAHPVLSAAASAVGPNITVRPGGPRLFTMQGSEKVPINCQVDVDPLDIIMRGDICRVIFILKVERFKPYGMGQGGWRYVLQPRDIIRIAHCAELPTSAVCFISFLPLLRETD